MTRVRVLVVDDHRAMRDAVVNFLKPTFEVVGVASDGQEALAAIDDVKPDVLVLDISMTGLGGLEVARRLHQAGSEVKVVFLTVHEERDFVDRALAAGALGYVIKPRIVSDLAVAIREAHAGRTFVSPTLPVDGGR